MKSTNPERDKFVMESKIAKAIHLRHHPVTLIWSDEKSDGAMQFQEKRGLRIFFRVEVRTSLFSRWIPPLKERSRC